MRKKAFWIFLATMIISVSSALVFIQSRYFANILKHVAKKYMPFDLGVEGDFSELEIKFLPPGAVIYDPSLVLKAKNPVGLPGGTKVNAKYIDVTFQFFQFLAGTVNINAVAIHGASLKLDLDEKFFAQKEKDSEKTPIKKNHLSWDSIVRLQFRSFSLVDSDLELHVSREGAQPLLLATHVKEITVGRTSARQFAAYDLAADIDKTYFEYSKIKQRVDQLQLSSELSASGLKIHNFGVQDGELNLHVNGDITGNVLNPKTLKTDVQYIVKGPVQEWLGPRALSRFVKLPKDLSAEGLVTIEGNAKGNLLDIKNTAEASATVEIDKPFINDWKAERAVLKAEWKTPFISLESAEVDFADGKVTVDGAKYDVSADTSILTPKVHFENADLRKMMGPLILKAYPLHLFLTGDANTEIAYSPDDGDFEVNGDILGDVTDFSFDNQSPKERKPLEQLLSIPKVHLKGGYTIDKSGAHFRDVKASLPNTTLSMHGSVDGTQGFNLDIQGPIDLADIHKLASSEIHGKGDLHWMIKGLSPDIFLIFDAKLANAGYLNMELGNVQGKVTWDDKRNHLLFDHLTATQGRSTFDANGMIDLGDVESVNLEVQVPKGTVPDFAKVFSFFLKRGVPWYPWDLTGGITGTIHVTGKPELEKFSAMGDLSIANVDFKHEIIRSGHVKAGYRLGAFVAEDVSVLKKYGYIKGFVVYGTDNILRFEMRSEGLTTLDIDQLSIWEVPYRAPLRLLAKGEGRIGHIKGEFGMYLGPGSVNTIFVPPSDFEVSLDDERAKANLMALGGAGHMKINWGLKPGSASTFEAEANHLNILPMVDSLNPDHGDEGDLTSDISGSAKLRFRTGELSRMSGTIDVRSLFVSGEDYDLAISNPFHLEINDGEYHLNEVRVVGRGTSLALRGESKRQLVDFHLIGTADISVLEYLVPAIGELKGGVQVNAELTGRADSPSFKTKISTTGIDLRMRSMEQPIENLKFTAMWNDSSIAISDISAKFASGLVAGRGDIELYLTKAPDLNFQFVVDNAKVKVYPVTYARTTGKFTVIGDDIPYKVKGAFRVDEALVRENFSLSEGSNSLRSSQFLPQKGAGGVNEGQVLDLDLDVVADHGVLIQNDLFDAEVRANLKIINSLRTPRLLGNIVILRGKLFFKDNFFLIQNGSVTFDNPSLLDPEIVANAQAEVKGYKVILVASGRVSNYKLSFESQPPLSQNDIINLLTLGMTSQGLQDLNRDTRAAYTSSEMYGLLFSQSGISRGLQDKLGVQNVHVRLDQSQLNVPENVFRPSDITETASPKVVIQTEIVKNLNASAGSTVGVGTNKEQTVNLEYKLPTQKKVLKDMSVIGVYEDQRGPEPGTSTTSVGGDLKYKIRF